MAIIPDIMVKFNSGKYRINRRFVVLKLYNPHMSKKNPYDFTILFGRVFLLEILTDKKHRDIIRWVGEDGEFKFIEPEKVAELWGACKNKPNMNYEKLSRALRYYYDGDMIAKVKGERYVYKFVCDLKELMGYNSKEMSDMVNDVPRQPRPRRYPNENFVK